MINKFFEVLRAIWHAIKKVWQLMNEEEDTASRLPENQTIQQSKAPQPQIEVARSVSLGLASTDAPKYRKNKSLLTKPEHILYQALLHASNNEFMVFTKVRMGDFVFLANEPQDRKFHVNQVLCKHVDFLLCENQTLEPVLVVELDDSSHKQYEQSERDMFKDQTFTAIGLPFLRIKLQQQYDSQLLQAQIKEKVIRKI